jgi:fructose PTS system EIIBC or EIIC component
LPVADYLTPARIAVRSPAADKDAVLAALVALAVPAGEQRDGLLADIRKREAQFTTALGDGIALPHARSRHVGELQMSALQLVAPVAFGAVDGVPVQLAFLVASPADAPGVHLDCLRALSALFNDKATMAALRTADSPEQFLSTLRYAEAR